MHHLSLLIARRKSQLSVERNNLPKGEKVKPPTDLLGALVAGQLDAESSGDKSSGLTPEELLGNVCEYMYLHVVPKSDLTV